MEEIFAYPLMIITSSLLYIGTTLANIFPEEMMIRVMEFLYWLFFYPFIEAPFILSFFCWSFITFLVFKLKETKSKLLKWIRYGLSCVIFIILLYITCLFLGMVSYEGISVLYSGQMEYTFFIKIYGGVILGYLLAKQFK